MHLIVPKQAEETPIFIANTVGSHLSHVDVRHSVRAVQGMKN